MFSSPERQAVTRDVPAPGDVTLATYEAAAQRYRERTAPPGAGLVSFLDRLAELVGAGDVLELGSGPGREAGYLEGRGLRVKRTDATRAFVDMMRADGHEARLLDARTGDLGGPYDAVLAHAMLLHLTRQEFHEVLVRIRRAVVGGGVLAFTVKEGDGECWSEAKLDLPRFFTFWREAAARTALDESGWAVLSIDHVAGRYEPWLYVLARTA